MTQQGQSSASKKSTQAPNKVFDVRRPGRGIVPATSRPVIVGHGGQVRDPVVVDTQDSAQKTQPQPSDARQLRHDPSVTLQPLHGQSMTNTNDVPGAPPLAQSTLTPMPNQDVPVSVAGANISSSALSDSIEPAGVTQSQTTDSPTPTGTSESTPPQPQLPNEYSGLPDMSHLNADVASEPDQPAPQPSQSQQPTASVPPPQEPQPQQPLQQIAQPTPKQDITVGLDMRLDDGRPQSRPKTTVSYHQRSRRLTMWLVTILCLLIVAVVVVDLLLDGGFITIKNLPHTHFF